MYGDKIINPYSAYNLIGFTAGCVISVLLTVLTARTAKLRDAGWPNVAVAICSLMWNLGGFAHSIAATAGVPVNRSIIGVSLATQFTGAATWPVPLIAIWSRYAANRYQRVAFRIL